MAKKNTLPKWFKLDKYKVAETYSAEQWFAALSTRYGYIYCLDIYEAYLRGEKNVDQGLANLSRLRANQYYESICKHDTSTYYPNNLRTSLSTLTVLDIFDCLGNLKKQDEVAHSYFKKYYDSGLPLLLSDKMELTHTIPSSMVGYVKIDLMSSEEQIKEELHNWLLIERSKHPIDKMRDKGFSEKDFKKWIEHKILAYLDLKIWSRESETEMDKTYIIRTLFPTIVDESSKDAAIKEHADKLMTAESMHVFHAQIQNQVLGQKTIGKQAAPKLRLKRLDGCK